MDQVFDSQFQAMQAAFARDGIRIQIAYTPDGRPDYLYVADRLLAQTSIVTQIRELLPGAEEAERTRLDGLTVLSIAHLEGGYRTVPEALDFLDAELAPVVILRSDENPDEMPPAPGGIPLVTPVHVLHLAGRICPAGEPEVPCCCAADGMCPPCPPAAPGVAGTGPLVGICDTGLLADIAGAPWLAGVTGDLDPLGPLLASFPPIPGGLHDIPQYTGHGTFAAGVLRCQAPGADVYVSGTILTGGGVLEYVLVEKLEEMIGLDPAPQVVNLSAGGYTRKDLVPLSFTVFDRGGVTLTAAAGNDSTCRPFWPAAFDWAVGVGALGADQRDRAWFSNYGNWVDVYTLGEGLVNAYAAGVYTYQEPPKRPAKQIFDGMARWSGTSFAAPLVAGLIAAQMSGGVSATAATQALLSMAADQDHAIPGVGPALFPWQP
jgi:hypothetical protein